MRKSVFAIMALLLILSLCLVVAPAQAAGYALTVQVQKTGGGMVSVDEGALGVKVSAKSLVGTNTCIITAVPRNLSCTFTGWIVVKEVTPGSTTFGQANNPTTTVTMTDKATVEAQFSIPANSTLTVVAKTVGGGAGGAVAITGQPNPTTLVTGTKVEVVATANPGFSFFCWSWNMGFATTKKATTKFTMCGDAVPGSLFPYIGEVVYAYFVPLSTDQLKLASYWTYETTWGREDTYRTYTKVYEDGLGNYTSILTSDKPEVSCSNTGTSSLGFSVGASRMVLEGGSLQNIMGKNSALYMGRNVLTDLWYWDDFTSPYYYGGPAAGGGTMDSVMNGMPVVVYTDGYSGGYSQPLTANVPPSPPPQFTVEVASVSGFFPGEAVVISDSAVSEQNVIAAVGASRLAPFGAAAAQSNVVVIAGGGYSVGDNVTLADVIGTWEICNIAVITPNAPFPGLDTLTMAANLTNNYLASNYPNVTLNRLTMALPLNGAGYSTLLGAQVAVPIAGPPGTTAGLPYWIGKTWNYVEHQGVFYKIPLQVTVADREVVRVPAGLFDCYKVVTLTMDLMGQFTVPYRTDWYCEKVHMPVRTEYFIYAQPMQSGARFTPQPVRVQTEVLKKYKLNPLGW